MKISKKEERLYMNLVLDAHNITRGKDGYYYCNDGDGMKNVWEALEHSIWLDLLTCDAKDYHDLISNRIEKLKPK